MTRLSWRWLPAFALLACGCAKQNGEVFGALHVEPATYDLGVLDEWIEPDPRFRFRNASDRVVTITGLEASCVCTSIVLMLDGQAPVDMTAGGRTVQVAAGARGSIALHTKLHRLEGRRDFVVRCFSDDKEAPIVLLRWAVTVRPYCRVTPDAVVIDDVSWEGESTFAVRISSEQPGFRITGHAPVPGGWRLHVAEVEGAFEARGVCVPQQAATFATSVVLHTNGPIADIKIPVQLRMQPVLEVTPKNVFSLSPNELVAGKELALSIRSVDGAPLCESAVTLVHGTHAADAISWQSSQPAPDVLDLRAVVLPTPADRLMRMCYSVATGHPRQGEVELTIVGRPARKR